MNIRRINRRLKKRFGPAVTAALSEGNIVLSGRLPTWEKVIEACSLAAEKYSTTHVVNEIRCDEAGEQPIRMPTLRDTALEGRKLDVLIIGWGLHRPGAFQMATGYPAGGKGSRSGAAGFRPQ